MVETPTVTDVTEWSYIPKLGRVYRKIHQETNESCNEQCVHTNLTIYKIHDE